MLFNIFVSNFKIYLSHTVVGGLPDVAPNQTFVSGRLLLSATEVGKNQTAVIDESLRPGISDQPDSRVDFN